MDVSKVGKTDILVAKSEINRIITISENEIVEELKKFKIIIQEVRWGARNSVCIHTKCAIVHEKLLVFLNEVYPELYSCDLSDTAHIREHGVNVICLIADHVEVMTIFSKNVRFSFYGQ